MNAVMAGTLADILDGAAYPSRRHETALYLAVECWSLELDEQPNFGRESLASRIKARWKQDLQDDGYGFVVVTFLLITALAAAISWAIERLLDWLYPKGALLKRRLERLLAAKRLA